MSKITLTFLVNKLQTFLGKVSYTLDHKYLLDRKKNQFMGKKDKVANTQEL